MDHQPTPSPSPEDNSFSSAAELAGMADATPQEDDHIDESGAEHNEALHPQRFMIDIVGPDQAEDFAAAADVEAKVFFDAFGNTAEELADAYRDYPSQFMVVKDMADPEHPKVASVLRFARNSPSGFKSLNDLHSDEFTWDKNIDPNAKDPNPETFKPETTLDILTIGTDRGYRQKDNPDSYVTSLAVYRALMLYCEKNNIQHCVTVLEEKVYNRIQQLGEPLQHYANVGSGYYMGSESSTPLYIDVDAALAHAKEVDPDIYELVAKGMGLEDYVSEGPGFDQPAAEATPDLPDHSS